MTDEELRIRKLLSDIHKSATKIVARVAGTSDEDFSGPSGEDLQDIVARRMGIIGEASALKPGGTRRRRNPLHPKGFF